MSDEIRVIAYGLGPIGSAAARLVAQRSGLRLVGGVDIDPAKIVTLARQSAWSGLWA